MHKDGIASYNLYDWIEEENLDFCVKYLEEVVLQAEVKEDASEVIKKLKDDGNTIYIISSRALPMFKTPYETTEKFLKEKNIIKVNNWKEIYIIIREINEKGEILCQNGNV